MKMIANDCHNDGANSGHFDLMTVASSMRDALWAIANMQVKEETDRGEVLEICMSIARLELEKCSYVVDFVNKGRRAENGESE